MENSFAVTHSVCFSKLELVFPAPVAAAFSADKSQEGAQLLRASCDERAPILLHRITVWGICTEMALWKVLWIRLQDRNLEGFYMPGNQIAPIFNAGNTIKPASRLNS